MTTSRTSRLTDLLITVAALTGLTATAYAVPIEVDLLNNVTQYSFVHDSATAGATGVDPDDYLAFDDGQSLLLDLTGGILSLAGGTQLFSLTSVNGASATLDITSLLLDLNDTDGFLDGTMGYSLDGTAGTFTFTNTSYGTSPFNSSTFDGSQLEFFIWGGDTVNDLGIDLGASGTVVSEPSILVLMGLGLLGIGASLRRR